MGLQVILNFQSMDNVVFDLPAMNAHFMKPGFGSFNELFSEFTIGETAYHTGETYQGPFILDGNGDLKIACREEDYFAQYADYTEVWGCFDKETAEDMAKFMKSGRMVLRLEIEGNETKYFIIEPNQVTMKLQSQLII
jgi:hypothetical protein